MTLATDASSALPAAVIAAMAGTTSFKLAASVTQDPGLTSATATDAISGTVHAPATITDVPAIRATGTAQFGVTGDAVIVVPATKLTITPEINTTPLAAINCTTTAEATNVKVTVTPLTVGTTGPLYTCVISGGGRNNTSYWHMQSVMTATGSKTTGSTETVSYTNVLLGSVPSISGLTAAKFTGSLPVTGAQSGTIAVNQSLDLSSSQPTVTGKLKLTAAGTDTIADPGTFTIELTVPAGTVPMTCTIQKPPAPAGLTLAVKAPGGPTASASPTPTSAPTASSTGGGQPQGSGFPSGAPATGGGTGSGTSIALVSGGVALAVAGGGLVLVARRRRGHAREVSGTDVA
jgi:hypothetical protein